MDFFENKIELKDLEVGKIYGSTAVGEFQKDSSGRIWFKSAFDGTIREVRPREGSLFYYIKDIEKG